MNARVPEEEVAGLQVFADQLESLGDPRGPLLALVLASALAEDPSEARGLNREAQRLREQQPQLWAPAGLEQRALSMRAGFPLYLPADEVSEAIELLGDSAAAMRQLAVRSHDLEMTLVQLEPARALGLHLDGLSERYRRAETSLDSELWRDFERAGSGPAVDRLVLASRLSDHACLAESPLESLHLSYPLSATEQSALASAKLRSLHLSRIDGMASFAHTLANLPTTLRSFGVWNGLDVLGAEDLQPLARLEGLETLSLPRCTAEGLASLRALPKLRSLTTEGVDVEGLEQLVELGLDTLSLVDVGPEPALLTLLTRFRGLKTLTLSRLHQDAPVDVSLLGELEGLEELELTGNFDGRLTLGPVVWSVELDRRCQVEVEGAVRCLKTPPGLDHDPRLLAEVEDLVLYEVLGVEDPGLDRFAGCARLQYLTMSLALRSRRDQLWERGPAWFDTIPDLRAFCMFGATAEQRARLGAAHPEIEPNNFYRWPRPYALD